MTRSADTTAARTAGDSVSGGGPAVSGGEDFSFIGHLAGRERGGAGLTKGERTRLRLLRAAAGLFAEGPYHDVRMVDISAAAGGSNGVVYRYFTDKRDVTIAVFTEFIRFTQDSLLRFRMPSDPRGAFTEIFRHYVRMYAANAGLMACLRHLSEEIPEIGRMLDEGQSEWCGQIAGLLRRVSFRNPMLGEGQEAWTVRALSDMAAEFLYSVHTRRSPMLAGLRDRPDLLGELLASVWMRVCLNIDYPARSREGRGAVTPGDYLPMLMSGAAGIAAKDGISPETKRSKTKGANRS